MTAMNNTINILKPFLKKLEEVYGDTLHFDDNDGKKYGYVVGTGGVIINVSMRNGSLAISSLCRVPRERPGRDW